MTLMTRTLPALLVLLATSCATLSDVPRRSPDEALSQILAARAPFDDRIAWSERATTIPQDMRMDLERLAVRHPEHVPTRRAAGWAAFDHNDLGAARRHADAALQIAPHDADARVLRARLALAQGNLSLARGLLEDGVALRPDAPQLAVTLAGVAFLDGDLGEAARELDRAERLGAPGWQVAYNRGLVAERTGDSQDAIDAYTAALRDRPDHEPSRWHLRALGVDPDTL